MSATDRLILAPVADLEFHPLANLFPLLAGAELDALTADIRENGLRHPIMLHDGKILDGRNRYRACQKAGIEPRFTNYTEFDGPSPIAFVVSENIRRRHLNESQRAMIAARLADMPQGARNDLEHSAEMRKVAQPEAAALLNVGLRTVQEAKAILRDAPERAAAIDAGDETVSEVSRELRKARIVERVATIPTGKFRVLYADPPWKYGDTRSLTGWSGMGAEAHYPTMALEDICALPIGDLTDPDAVLWLWATSPLLPEALKVLEAWGFTYKASFVWSKLRHVPGNYNSVRHEFLLLGTRGSCVPDVSTLFESVQTIERTGRHSEKPAEFRRIIETLYPHGRRLELFARAKAEGWEVYGNEVAEASSDGGAE